nr:hypothetical protein JVH1_4342 [Rhodococcus sp. JVH1]
MTGVPATAAVCANRIDLSARIPLTSTDAGEVRVTPGA